MRLAWPWFQFHELLVAELLFALFLFGLFFTLSVFKLRNGNLERNILGRPKLCIKKHWSCWLSVFRLPILSLLLHLHGIPQHGSLEPKLRQILVGQLVGDSFDVLGNGDLLCSAQQPESLLVSGKLFVFCEVIWIKTMSQQPCSLTSPFFGLLDGFHE